MLVLYTGGLVKDYFKKSIDQQAKEIRKMISNNSKVVNKEATFWERDLTKSDIFVGPKSFYSNTPKYLIQPVSEF